ncbi:MAG: hypothetical protein ACRC61_07125 [Aeromonas salmonicida]
MGIELYITRANHWAENEGNEIGAEEWRTYVDTDPELQFFPENGDYFVRWNGQSKYEDPWLDWFGGNILTKWPDTALYRKMLQIAQHLNAKIQDDDGNLFISEDDWEFDPTAPPSAIKKPLPWWKRILGK